MENENRLIAVLQIFTIILVFKGISATYFATKYSYYGDIDLINKATHILTIIPIFLFLALILISLPLIYKNLKEKAIISLDVISVFLIIISLVLLFI